MPKLRPLDLPELRRHVALYLDQPSLKACTLVNKTWHDEFQPLVWSNFRFSYLLRRTMSDQGLTSIRRNARSIRRLCAHYLDDGAKIPPALHQVFAEHCRALTTVDTIFPNDAEWQLYMALISVNTQLRTLHLRNRHGFKQFIQADQLPYQLRNHHQLTTLTLDGAVSVATLRQILSAIPSLEVIQVGSDTSSPPSSPSSPTMDMAAMVTALQQVASSDSTIVGQATAAPTVFKLREFSIDDYCEDPAVADLLVQCPHLEALRLPSMTTAVGAALCKMFKWRFGHFPQLRRLTLGSDKPQPAIHREILQCVPAQQLVQVAIYTATAREVQWLIDRQYKSLEDVYVRTDEHEAHMGFLARCRRLKQISLDGDKLVDIRRLLERPWACEALEVFDIGVGVDRKCKDTRLLRHALEEKEGVAVRHRQGVTATAVADEKDILVREEWEQAEVVFMQRLGQLTQLRQVEKAVDNFFRPKTSQMDLSWRLSNGLMFLAGLSQMERMHLGCDPKGFGVPELEFMKAHWPRLKRLNAFRALSDEAQDWIREHWPSLKVEDGLFAAITLLPD